MNFISGQNVPLPLKGGPKMTTTSDGKGLIMTYEKAVYSFHCKSQTNCFWTKEETQLQISRKYHMMLTIPSTLVENCDCELDDNGNCKCPAGVTGEECDICQLGYWGLNHDGKNRCKSKFLSIISLYSLIFSLGY